ncbi:MAG TPA: hypothetical protein DDW27_19485 [Bacteroidales bacterium]|nr:hypothetical protein [Bacteroidales bacterium]
MGQPVHKDIVVTIDQLNYDYFAPGIGIVSGTYTYHFSYKLSKEGWLEAIHWNARDFKLYNEKGDKVIVTDSGHDTYGILWPWFNTPDLMNEYNPAIDYDCEEGWLDDLMPDPMPSEGVSVEMGCKVLCKGVMLKMSFMAIFHLNANGVESVDIMRP